MANQAVVGVLRTLLTADTAQFDASMRKVSASVVKFEKETIKLTQQGERMARAFSGDKMLASANQLTAAVAKVGGAAKLTEAEQRRVNAQLTEAIAKYQALGRQAPASMLALQRATAQVDVATSKWGSRLTQVSGLLSAFGISLGVGALIGFSRELFRMADELVKVADQTGLTTTEVQELQFVAQQSGNSLEQFTGAVGQLQNRLATGDKSAIAALKALNINLDEIRRAAPIDQVQMIARAIGQVEDPAARAAIAMDLFGRTGIQILPALISDFEKLRAEAPRMSDATVRALDELGDQFDRLKTRLFVFAGDLFGFLFQGIATWSRRMASGLEVVAGLLESVGIGAGKIRERAAALRAESDRLTASLSGQAPEVRKNTGAYIDYEALLERTRGTTRKVAEESDKLIPINRELFRSYVGLSTAIQDTNASMQAYHLVATSNIEDAFAWAKAEKDLNAELARTGAILTNIEDNDASQEAAEIGREQRQTVLDEWVETTRQIGEHLTMSISDALAQSLLRMRSFKDAFLSIWQSIQRAFADILATMLDQFIRGFIDPLMRKLGEFLGGIAVGGGGSGGLVSAAGGALPGMLGGAGGGAGAAGGAGGGAGFLTNPAFWTNPWTIAGIGGIALGLAVWKKGLFRGGEEALHVNPRRDRFFSQFGDPSNKGVGGANHNLASILTEMTGEAGGGALFRAMSRADSVKEFEAAQSAIIAQLAKGGMRGIKSYALGGFTPPGVTELALLHGGVGGELHLPVAAPASGAAVGMMGGNRLQVTIYAMDGADVKRVMDKHLPGWLNREMALNQHGVPTQVRRAVRP